MAIHLLRRVRREDQTGTITPAQSSALSVIVYAGPISVGDLAHAEQVRSPTMTRVVDQLVSGGWAHKEAAAGDGRRTLVQATDAGIRWIAEGRQKRVVFLARRLESLSPGDLATLRRSVDILGEVLEHPHHS